jgi:hypothetical protein
MNDVRQISKDHFTKRLVDLCLRSGLSGFPKDDVDQHILLKSAVLTFDQSATYTEQDINAGLQYWINQVTHIKGIDHGTLRRWLIDAGYLTRSKDGSSYQVSPSGNRAYSFDAAIEQVDVAGVIQNGREEIERRKREYMEKSKKKT